MRLLLCAALVGCAVAGVLPSAIAVASDAPLSDAYAAAELKSHLELACPQRNFSLGPPAGPHGGHGGQILVGPGAAVSSGVPALKLSGLGNESFYVGAFAPPLKASIVLSGGIGSSRGSLYAVYHFLVDLGFDFLAHDETTVPACPDTLPTHQSTRSPAFEYRDSNEHQPETQQDWASRVGYNRHGDAKHGGHVDYATPPGFVHTSYHLLTYPDPPPSDNSPPASLYQQHPSWFWPRSSPHTYGQLCWTNASLVAFMTEQARKVLRDQPDALILSISQNDNGNQCEDAAEQAVNQKEGSPIGALLIAVNAIAAALEDEFPHVAFDTLAYQWTRPAPTSGLRPRPNVIIRLCTIECDFAHPLTHANNAPFARDMRDWSKISNRTYIWNYVTNFAHYVAPFPNWHVLVPNLRFFRDHGVKGVFEEGTYATSGGDLVQLKDYVMARALWNPDLDGDALIQSFLDGYFGAAAPHVRTYMDAMVSGIDDHHYYMHESFDEDAPFLTPALLLRSAQAFADASTAVASDPVRARRVNHAAMPVMYVVLVRWDAMRLFAKTRGLTWPYSESKRSQFDEFKRRYTEVGISKLDEGGSTIDSFEKKLFPSIIERLARLVVGRPAACAGSACVGYLTEPSVPVFEMQQSRKAWEVSLEFDSPRSMSSMHAPDGRAGAARARLVLSPLSALEQMVFADESDD